MLNKLQAVASRFEELCARSEQPDFYNDPKKAAAILREKNDLEPIVSAYLAYRKAQQDMAEAEELMSDPEMKELCQQTWQEAKKETEALYSQLQILLLPKDPNDEKNVIMEIRGGVGGEESALFAHSLFRMYSMYAAKMGWKVELMNYNDTELGGVKEADFVISGRGAYSRLKYESGLHRELQILLLPKDPNDDKSVIVEIRGGVGGEESALFAHSHFRMNSMYAASHGYSVELMNYNDTELGGVKEADFIISGRGAYSRLKYESGVHRVQRVPETESGGRVHTSTATVAVLPEMEEASVEINPTDIEMQVYRASGAGGQHVNKTSSAVRLIHRPSGIVGACQEERSQLQNREKCMRMLASKLYEIEQEKLESQVTGMRRSQVGTGMRNERIRTYNFPQGRVTDHRIGLTLYKIESVMDGGLDELIDALATADQAEKLKNAQY